MQVSYLRRQNSCLSKNPFSVKTLLFLSKSDLTGGLYKILSKIGLDLSKSMSKKILSIIAAKSVCHYIQSNF